MRGTGVLTLMTSLMSALSRVVVKGNYRFTRADYVRKGLLNTLLLDFPANLHCEDTRLFSMEEAA